MKLHVIISSIVFDSSFIFLVSVLITNSWYIILCGIFTVFVFISICSGDSLFPLPSLTLPAGSKAAAVEFSNSVYEIGSPASAGPQQVVQLAEDLKLALELQSNQEERETLRAQLPEETARALLQWLQTADVSTCCLQGI